MGEFKHWKVVEHMTENCRLVSVERLNSESQQSGLVKAFVKWDGCANLLFRGDDHYVHSCNLDDLISELIELREIASKEGVEGYEEPR